MEEAVKTRRTKLDRQANYGIVAQEMTEWQPIVKRNREATQLDYTTNPDAHLANFANKLNSNDLKSLSAIKDIAGAAREVDAAEATADPSKLTDAAQEALQKHKHLLLYQELKAKRLKKIKSKVYRRIKKKQREREEAKQLGAKLDGNKEALMEEIEKMERKRAEVGSTGTRDAAPPQQEQVHLFAEQIRR